jgi:hypothetical protein
VGPLRRSCSPERKPWRFQARRCIAGSCKAPSRRTPLALRARKGLSLQTVKGSVCCAHVIRPPKFQPRLQALQHVADKRAHGRVVDRLLQPTAKVPGEMRIRGVDSWPHRVDGAQIVLQKRTGRLAGDVLPCSVSAVR